MPRPSLAKRVEQRRQCAGVRVLAVAGNQRSVRRDDLAPAGVGAEVNSQRGVEGRAAEYPRIDACEEPGVAVVLDRGLPRRQPVERTVGPGDETVETDGHIDADAWPHRSLRCAALTRSATACG